MVTVFQPSDYSYLSLKKWNSDSKNAIFLNFWVGTCLFYGATDTRFRLLVTSTVADTMLVSLFLYSFQQINFPSNELFLLILRPVWYFLPFTLYLICIRCNLARRNLRIKNHLFWQTCPNEANYCRSKAWAVVNVVRVVMTSCIQQVPRLAA